ncbi:conserved hypothetical protein [Sulfolobus islandicus Y.G.57.14]|jgi:predicted RNA-binding Zn-ribbon protein involved in translation (DUF1610 family)|uniref:Chromatin protein Cren7 n=8 Tax=Saccharolobus islandicus TaxID=43080 RepID=C3MPT8_SACI2|nr:hypothetical protein [Sulfolobus islandicus]ACP35401.1 conserved hypothetical protein [Sulfolobus islandicus L.S.2.15]ACP38061.1 conserved hypothetical protein [Sulfolobus islandicus M.14.25]ACP45567.1 conserved hypothetical protein [Sulfolobus islandicus Y.G.57.14]ACP48645.1 conserved hypothetical protein [Sulfolobus islandicus Y.N.15.51]ACP55239.1 conserved hypothetical protein [Sulfolobus islandicus M.16.27]
MPKKKQFDPYVCPNCGTKVEKAQKTWQLVSPLPDSYGRITITVMGSFVCPNCGHKWKSVVSKIKAGGSSVEIEGKKGVKKIQSKDSEEKANEGEVIELDLSDLDEDEEE